MTKRNFPFGSVAAAISASALAFVLNTSPSAWAGPLHDAAKDGDVSVITELVAGGAEIDEPKAPLGPPLHWAAARGHVEAVQALIDAGADHSVLYSEQATQPGGPHTALRLAVQFKRTEVVRLLLEAGVDPNIGDPKSGDLPLHLASKLGQVEVVRWMINHGADVNIKGGRYRYTPLHEAANGGSVAVIELLTAAGGDLDHIDEYGYVPMNLAIRERHLDAVKKLVELGADLSVRAWNDLTPLGFARGQSQPDIVAYLESVGATE